MFVLGHLGVGSGMLGPLRKRLPVKWLFLGCLLPDLIDKPLFYLMIWLHGWPVYPIRGSRSFGHTLIFLAGLTVLALVTKRPLWRALAAGVATHLALDLTGELITGADPESSIWLALLWPGLGGAFPLAKFTDPLEHLMVSAASLYNWLGEIAGALLLWRQWRNRSRPN